MIAAKDPQEFIPSGRQQLQRHPGLSELYNAQEEEGGISSQFMHRFEKVSIADAKDNEWWIVRKTPNWYKEKKGYSHGDEAENASSKSGLDINRSRTAEISDSNWISKTLDVPFSFHKTNKHLSDTHLFKRRCSIEKDLANESYKVGATNESNEFRFKTVGITMEEELYVKDNVVIWSKGLVSSGNSIRFDSSRMTVCSYTSHYPVKFVQWCTFYCQRPTLDRSNIVKFEDVTGTPMHSICIMDSQNLQVFTVDNEDMITTLPFQVDGMWTTQFGLLFEKEKKKRNQQEEEVSPTVFSLVHPLDEVRPVAIRQGTVRLLDDPVLRIVFTSEEPSMCVMYDGSTGQHSVYCIRRIRNDEWLEISDKLASAVPSIHNLSDRLKSRVSVWNAGNKGGPPAGITLSSSRPPSAISSHSHSLHAQQCSRSYSPMAAISRCQSPTISPLITGNPWLRLSRQQSSLPTMSANASTTKDNTTLLLNTFPEAHHHINPSLCFDHIWTDMFISQQEGLNAGPASKVFLSRDLVDRQYLCYLIPSRLQLCIVHVECFDANSASFGIFTSIGAKDAVAITHLCMIAILEHGGGVVLYSGLTMVGKLHIGGVLAQHAPSPCSVRTLPQFNSPFPRRSTLMPHYGTPKLDPVFDEHLISPVLPLMTSNRNFNQHIQLQIDPIKCSDEDLGKVEINGLRDAVEDRLTLQYSDNTYYRIALPAVASSTLVENCLSTLRCTLQRDYAITLFTRWYAARNAPGPEDLCLEGEWNMFTSLVYELLGYESHQSSSDNPTEIAATPSSLAKKQRTCFVGSNNDWNLFLDNCYHKRNVSNFGKIFSLGKCNKITPIVNCSETQMNVNSVLFPCIKVIHYSLHLLYEELKLNTVRTEELPYLALFLSKLSRDLMLNEYVIHYWKDFPEHCTLNVSLQSHMNSHNNDLKNTLQWPAMNDKLPSIMAHIYDLLNDVDVSPFPFITTVNVRSKAVVQLCGILISGTKRPNVEIYPDDFVKSAIPRKIEQSSTPKSASFDILGTTSERIVLLMNNMGITSRDLDSFPAAISILLHDALWQCRENPPTNWTSQSYNLLQRPDLAAQAQLIEKSKLEEDKVKAVNYNEAQLPEVLSSIKQVEDLDLEDGMEDVNGALLKLRFPSDHRVIETRRLLQSSKPVAIVLIQRPDVSDHDFIEEQEKHLYAICARTMALPVGRGMFTLRTAIPVVTEPLPLPKLCLTGKAPPRGVTVELSHIDYPQNMQQWPLFHNGVANGLRISPDARNIDSTWITFNRPKNGAETSMEHGGFLMALGLNGHLPNLAVLNTYNYLSKVNEMTSIGVLLGLASAMRGQPSSVLTRMISIHVEALLPPTSMELDLPQNVQVAALLSVGLLYQGSAHRHITEVLLAEIGRPPGPEMENCIDRESYSLAAGLALGLVALRQGGRPSGMSDLNVPDMLHYYMVGGNRRPLQGCQSEKYKVASFQIREGSTVNLDVTAPGATLALGLMYLRSGNKALADWMSPPTTEYLLDFVRPDFLMLRILSRGLIMWDEIAPTQEWIEDQVPQTIRPFCMVKPSAVTSDIDYEAMNQAYCHIIAGACFAMGLKYAGSSNQEAFEALLHYCLVFTSITAKSIAELAGKPTIETCLNVILLSASMVMAGTGNLQIMRIVRHLRRRVGLASSAVVTYGSHLALHMALGLLFLGGGRYTLSNAPASVAALICAFYPKFPTHSSDNRYHLQAFRHLYVLAVESRLVIPKDVITGRMCYARLQVVYLNGCVETLSGPCFVPDLNTLSRLSIEDDRYWPVAFERCRNWEQLLKILASCGFIEVKQRAGCLSYLEDKNGYRSELARTLTQSKTIPWNPPPKMITAFASDCTIRHFVNNFLISANSISSHANEKVLSNMLTRTTYDCIIKDKEAVLSNIISLIKAIDDLDTKTCTAQLWQFKIVYAQVSRNSLLLNLVPTELILALYQKLRVTMDLWESQLRTTLAEYVLSSDLNSTFSDDRRLAYYIIFYDIPHNSELNIGKSKNFLSVLNTVNTKNCLMLSAGKILNILGVNI